MSQLVVVGSYNQDFIWRTDSFPVPGETRLGQFSTGPGGKGFNQAVAAARQGASVSFIGALGRDATGESAAALALAEGISAHWQWCDDHATGNAAILLNADGQNLIVVGPGANLALSATHIARHADRIGNAAALLVQHEVNPAATRQALELARKAGVATMLNPAPPLRDEDGSLLPLVDLLTPNETEFVHLLERYAGVRVEADELAAMSDPELQALVQHLPVRSVVLTLGAAGAFVAHGAAPRWRDAVPTYRVATERVKVHDTTGAGDAFSGSLAAALAILGDADFSTAIRHANRVAAMTTESAGAALSIPTRDQVVQRFG